jgi:hypothetical protein
VAPERTWRGRPAFEDKAGWAGSPQPRPAGGLCLCQGSAFWEGTLRREEFRVCLPIPISWGLGFPHIWSDPECPEGDLFKDAIES